MKQRELQGVERIVDWLPGTGQPAAVRFAASTGILALCFGLQLAFTRYLGLPGLSVLLFGVFICAALFNHGTGFYAGALAIPASYSTLNLVEHQIPTFTGAVVFSLICGAVALFGEGLRKALDRAVEAERTASIFLRELQHRTQNTLSIIVALLELQSRSAESPAAKEALKSAATRVRMQSEAHRHLTLSRVDKVDAKEYLSEVCRLLEQSLGGARPIKINCDIQPMLIDPQKALTLGLIANELVTNSIKYAFESNEAGIISAILDRDEHGMVRLRVHDNGRGCLDNAPSGMGTELIAALVKEHNGTYRRANRKKGCEVVVTLAAGPSFIET